MILGRQLRRLSPAMRRQLAEWTFDISLLLWPVTHVLAIVNGEKSLLGHFILALSMLAITLTSWDVVATADVRDGQEDG